MNAYGTSMMSPEEAARRERLKAQQATAPGHSVYWSLFGRLFHSMPDARSLKRSLEFCLRRSYPHHDVRELCEGLSRARISDSTIKLMIRDLGNATFERRAPGLLVPSRKLEGFSGPTANQAYAEVYSGYVDGVGSPGPQMPPYPKTASPPLLPWSHAPVAPSYPTAPPPLPSTVTAGPARVPWWGWLLVGVVLVRVMR